MSQIYVELYPNEERFNVVTHLPGVLLGIVGTVFLLLKPETSLISKAAFSIYGLTLTVLYSASCLYHNCKEPTKKTLLKKCDHGAIYLFMGGCYTPFVINNMIGPWKNGFLAVVWLFVVLGVAYKFLSQYRTRFLSVTLYIAFGFFCFVVKQDFLDQIPTHSFNTLVAGGACYLIGVIFYVNKSIPYHHAIWHLFVLLGSSFHYYAIYHS